MDEIYHVNNCQCGCDQTQMSGDRRSFLKQASALGLGLAFGTKVASGVTQDPQALHQIKKSHTVKSGKAQHFTLLHTSDIHAQLDVHDEFFLENGVPVYKKRGGMASLKTMIQTLKAENPLNTLVIDGGDCFQGGGVAALSEGKAIVPLMNNIGYDLMLPGNWEVVYGKDMMMRDLGAYDGAKICANMFHDTQDETKGDMIFPPYWTTRVAGIKIGFIGYNDPLTPKRQSPAYSSGIQFTDPSLNYEQCAMVFMVTHMGLAQQVDLANKPYVEGVDYILGADTHERVRKPIQGKYAKVTEPGAFGSFVAKLDIVVEDGVIKEHHYNLLDVDPERYQPDPEMLALVEAAKAPYRKELDTVIGSSKTTLVRYYVMENPMDNLITDALMWKLKPDIALSNGFRFCPPLVPDPKTKLASITNDYLWSMLPVDSEAKWAQITGIQLKQWLEKELENVFAKDPAKRFGGWVVRYKGMEVNFTAGKPKGERVNWIKIKGKKMEPEKLYSVIACDREGDPVDTLCRIEKVQNPKLLGISLHSIMREYLKKHSPVAPKVEGRIHCTDKPITLLSQLEGYDYDFI
jgi:2',3'-cyclic-nucleotide 2'-phosphodiesterase (5'-nucleotidase family)